MNETRQDASTESRDVFEYLQPVAEDIKHRKHRVTIGARVAGYKSEDDFYPTCSEAVYGLLSVERFDGAIWEPACGDGAISKLLISEGYDVISTDLRDRGYGKGGLDFLLWDQPAAAENIITNPPFNIADKFVEKAINLTKNKCAFLLRLAWLEGQKRKKLFEKHPPARVWVFSKRLPRMHKDGWEGNKTSGTVAFAWFVWDKNHKNKTELGWI